MLFYLRDSSMKACNINVNNNSLIFFKVNTIRINSGENEIIIINNNDMFNVNCNSSNKMVHMIN